MRAVSVRRGRHGHSTGISGAAAIVSGRSPPEEGETLSCGREEGG